MLHLTAQDAEDLIVISAQMQDAVLKYGDLNFNAKRHRLAFVANRFAWDDAKQKQRRRTGVHFDHVKAVQKLGFKNLSAETILSLLTISFVPKDELSGQVILTFSAGHQLRLDVECLDVAMSDLGPAWSTEVMPSHEV